LRQASDKHTRRDLHEPTGQMAAEARRHGSEDDDYHGTSVSS
jgi:hypothetical protein